MNSNIISIYIYIHHIKSVENSPNEYKQNVHSHLNSPNEYKQNVHLYSAYETSYAQDEFDLGSDDQ